MTSADPKGLLDLAAMLGDTAAASVLGMDSQAYASAIQKARAEIGAVWQNPVAASVTKAVADRLEGEAEQTADVRARIGRRALERLLELLDDDITWADPKNRVRSMRLLVDLVASGVFTPASVGSSSTHDELLARVRAATASAEAACSE